jgi:hypothetical protein
MPTDRVAALLHASARELRARFEKSTAASGHASSKGSVREDYLAAFLRDHLPRSVEVFGSAEIMTVDGELSPQCDVVIADPGTPPFFAEDRHRVVPNECVYGLVEVKSVLDAAALRDACERIATVRAMPKTAHYPTRPPFTYRVDAYGRTWDYWPTFGVVFAYESIDLKTLATRLMDWCATREPAAWPDSIWVLGKGYLLWAPEHGMQLDYSPRPGSGLVALEPLPGADVLLPMILSLHPLLVRAAMPGFRLHDYVAQAGIGSILAHFPWPGGVHPME